MTLREKLDYIVKTYYGGSTDSYIENFYYALEQAEKRNSEYMVVEDSVIRTPNLEIFGKMQVVSWTLAEVVGRTILKQINFEIKKNDEMGI